MRSILPGSLIINAVSSTASITGRTHAGAKRTSAGRNTVSTIAAKTAATMGQRASPLAGLGTRARSGWLMPQPCARARTALCRRVIASFDQDHVEHHRARDGGIFDRTQLSLYRPRIQGDAGSVPVDAAMQERRSQEFEIAVDSFEFLITP